MSCLRAISVLLYLDGPKSSFFLPLELPKSGVNEDEGRDRSHDHCPGDDRQRRPEPVQGGCGRRRDEDGFASPGPGSTTMIAAVLMARRSATPPARPRGKAAR